MIKFVLGRKLVVLEQEDMALKWRLAADHLSTDGNDGRGAQKDSQNGNGNSMHTELRDILLGRLEVRWVGCLSIDLDGSGCSPRMALGNVLIM